MPPPSVDGARPRDWLDNFYAPINYRGKNEPHDFHEWKNLAVDVTTTTTGFLGWYLLSRFVFDGSHAREYLVKKDSVARFPLLTDEVANIIRSYARVNTSGFSRFVRDQFVVNYIPYSYGYRVSFTQPSGAFIHFITSLHKDRIHVENVYRRNGWWRVGSFITGALIATYVIGDWINDYRRDFDHDPSGTRTS